jgi:hypothetical protein
MADAMELSKQVYDICCHDEEGLELKAFLETHPKVSVTRYRGKYNTQALHKASEYGHAACVRVLLDHGADVHARSLSDETALMRVCNGEDLESRNRETEQEQRLECMQILIEKGADVDAVDQNGCSSIIHASIWRRLKCLQRLIDNGADVNVDASHLASDEKRRLAASIEDYKRMHTFIDNQQTMVKSFLQDCMPVDRRLAGGHRYNMLPASAERVLGFLGYNYFKNQVVNASIDGTERKRTQHFSPLVAKIHRARYEDYVAKKARIAACIAACIAATDAAAATARTAAAAAAAAAERALAVAERATAAERNTRCTVS